MGELFDAVKAIIAVIYFFFILFGVPLLLIYLFLPRDVDFLVWVFGALLVLLAWLFSTTCYLEMMEEICREEICVDKG